MAVIAEGQAREGRARIGVINRAINLAIKPMSDLAQWGVADRWSAPLETLSSGRGDCEDYAIAKYVALAEAGIGEDDLRLVIVRDLSVAEDHAILAVRASEKWLLLDNRRLALLEDNELRRVQPLFALNGEGVREFLPCARRWTNRRRALIARRNRPTVRPLKSNRRTGLADPTTPEAVARPRARSAASQSGAAPARAGARAPR